MDKRRKPPNHLSPLEKKVLCIISQDNKINKKEIAAILGIGFYTVKEYIQKLRKKGRLDWEGLSRDGHWVLKTLENIDK